MRNDRGHRALWLFFAVFAGCGDDGGGGSTAEVAGSVETQKEIRRVYGYAYKGELQSASLTKDMERGLITDVAVSFAWIDGQGNLTSFDPTSSSIQQFVTYAHSKGVSVHLGVALFDSTITKNVLVSAQEKMTSQILAAVEAAKMDAVSLDFEAVPHTTQYRDLYSDFTEMIGAALHAKGLKLYHAVSQMPESNMDPVRICNASDGLMIMGYAYAGSWSYYAGPNAPYSTGGIWYRSYETDMLSPDNGKSWKVKTPDSKKLILGVPFYGHKFQVSTFGIKVPKVSGSSVPAITLPNTASYGTKWDPASKTPYWEWETSGVKYQAWYENAESMKIKFAGVKDAGFGGIGMWKLPWGTEPIWAEIEAYVNAE